MRTKRIDDGYAWYGKHPVGYPVDSQSELTGGGCKYGISECCQAPIVETGYGSRIQYFGHEHETTYRELQCVHCGAVLSRARETHGAEWLVSGRPNNR